MDGDLHKMRDKLVDELCELSDKELSFNSLELIDKLAHALKNINKVIVSEEYSYRMADIIKDLNYFKTRSKDEEMKSQCDKLIHKIEEMQ